MIARLSPRGVGILDAMEVPKYQIRTTYTEETITVYQAYHPAIDLPAARDNRFPEVWQRNRMTWIKPSFLWMRYRCGWATKEGQEVLAVEITRAGFEWALANSALSHFDGAVHRDHDTWQRDVRRTSTRPPAVSPMSGP